MRTKLATTLALLVLATAAAGADRALLVGCTEYPNLRKHRFYATAIRLAGPIHDVALMRETLVDHLGFPAGNITVLTGWKDGAASNPTRANILASLARLAETAKKGDRVLVLMAGHGSRQPDTSGDEPDGLDEIFLPADVKGWNGGVGSVENAIPDDELSARIRAIRDRGAVVCLLMDCCHAGTMVRGIEDRERSRRVDPAWLGVPATRARSGESDRSAFDDLDGIAVLYAAPAHRTAPEMKLPRGAPNARWHGLFSFMVARAFRRTSGATSFRELHAHVLAGYQALPYHGVAPVAEGDLDLTIGGGRSDRPPLWIRRVGNDVVLNAGRLSGVGPGTKLEVKVGDRSVTVVVERADTTRSTCRKPGVEIPSDRVLPATIVSTPVGDLRLRLHVRCEGDVPAEVTACTGNADPRFPIVDDPEKGDWQLNVDGQGGMTLRPLRSGAEIRFVAKTGELRHLLEQIFRAENLKRFVAGSPGSGLPAGLEVEVRRKGEPGMVPLEPGATMRPGDAFDLRIRNRSGRSWDVTVLVLDAHFGLTELFPRSGLARIDARDTKEQIRTGFTVTDTSQGMEHLLVLAVPATRTEETWLGWLAHRPLEITERAPEADPVKKLLREVAFGGAARGVSFRQASFHASLLTWRTSWGRLGPDRAFPETASIRVERRHVPSILVSGADEKAEIPAAWRERFRGDLSVLYRKVAPAVVVVRTRTGHGTGFLVDRDGTVLTNAHVVADGITYDRNGRQLVTIHRGELDREGWMKLREATEVRAEVEVVDEERDLARLRIRATRDWFNGMKPLALSPKPPAPGQECVLVGHPAAGLLWSMREGRVAQIGRMPHDLVDVLVARLAAGTEAGEIRERLLAKDPVRIVLSDCGGNPGDSGSPLLDRTGRVLGITYAIPADVRHDKFVYHVHLDELRTFLRAKPETGPAVPDAWRLGPKTALLKSDPAGGYDVLVGGAERPRQMLIDVDGDAKADPAKLGDIVATRSFDAEVALHFGPGRRTAFYDTDGDGAFDLVLVDDDEDEEADVRFSLRKGRWRVTLDAAVPWLSSDYLRFEGGAAAALVKFRILRRP